MFHAQLVYIGNNATMKLFRKQGLKIGMVYSCVFSYHFNIFAKT